MNYWKKESLGLKVGSWIIWRDEEIQPAKGNYSKRFLGTIIQRSR